MNILHTEWMEAKGGQAKRVLEDLKIIKEIGHKPYLACKPNSWLYKAAQDIGIETFPVKFKHIADPYSIWKLLQIINKNNIDIVHTHSSKDSYVATIAAKLTKTRVIRSRHMDFTKKPGLLYHLADAIVTTGEKIRKELILNGINENRVISIPSYPDETLFEPSENIRSILKKRYHIENNIVLGTLTGLKRDKRPDFLLDIFKELVTKHQNIKLFIAGVNKDAEFESKFYETVKTYNLEEYVQFIGYVKPEEFLNVIDIYICPSKKEGIPQSLMQAMMMGKACISSNVGSINDLNIENNLILIEKDNLKEFVLSLDKLIQNSELCKNLGDKNYKICRQFFNKNLMKEKLKKVYETTH